MTKIFIFCLLFWENIFISATEENINDDSVNLTSNFYTAAVLEFNSPGNNFLRADEIVDANLKEYVKQINRAKEYDVDILAFSEATLNYHGLSGDDLKRFAISLPQETSDSCDYSSNTILNDLSDAVRNVSIYVLINIVEMEEHNENESNENNFYLFNTNIVFNRYGCIISKYRKFNLFVEPAMNAPVEAELATFETDFGVTFGHFICFDILFKFPAYDLILSNITHLIYPSMWFSEIPFMTSIQIQQNFAYQNNIVLLSAGANSPSGSNTGSGIFIGKYGPADAIISYRNETKMIIAKVPKDIDDNSFIPNYPAVKSYTAFEMDKLNTWSFAPKNVYPLNDYFHFNDGTVECEFTVNYTELSIDENIGYTYKFTFFNDVRNYVNLVNAGEIYCAIIPCLSDDPKTCGQKFKNSDKLVPSVEFHSIKINMKIRSTHECLVMPTSLDFSQHSLSVQDFELSVFDIDDEIEEYEMESKNELSKILTFGIFGRNYSADTRNVKKKEPVVPPTTTELVEIEDTKINRDSKMKKTIEEDDEYIVCKLAIYSGLMVVLCIIAAILVYRRLQHPYEHPLIIMRRKSEMNTS